MSVAARLPRAGRRGGRVAAAVVVVGAIAVAAWLLLSSGDGSDPPAANDAVPLGSAPVERRDLVAREDVDGTLGFTGATSVAAPAAGTITRLRAEGDTVTRGRSLLSIDAKATAWVLYGSVPMYRDLSPGVSDGRDVRQLERNLKAFGYDPGTVDDDWTSATTDAVEAFQDDRGLTEDGSISRTEVVISDGAARVGRHRAEVGDPARAGAPVTSLTSTTPVVTAKLDAGLAADVERADRVRVTLPDGSEVGGRVTRVGTVASAGQDDSAATVGAPVSVSLETGRTKDALAVPVTALVATGPGRYAVELAGSRRLVPVILGAFADDLVQVEGAGLAPGTRVVVPR
jgi:hypothetical protein